MDEAHHAFGKALAKDMGIGASEKDTSLRTTIDMLAASLTRAGTRVEHVTTTRAHHTLDVTRPGSRVRLRAEGGDRSGILEEGRTTQLHEYADFGVCRAGY